MNCVSDDDDDDGNVDDDDDGDVDDDDSGKIVFLNDDFLSRKFSTSPKKRKVDISADCTSQLYRLLGTYEIEKATSYACGVGIAHR